MAKIIDAAIYALRHKPGQAFCQLRSCTSGAVSKRPGIPPTDHDLPHPHPAAATTPAPYDDPHSGNWRRAWADDPEVKTGSSPEAASSPSNTSRPELI